MIKIAIKIIILTIMIYFMGLCCWTSGWPQLLLGAMTFTGQYVPVVFKVKERESGVGGGGVGRDHSLILFTNINVLMALFSPLWD